jgi:hypothetical protein
MDVHQQDIWTKGFDSYLNLIAIDWWTSIDKHHDVGLFCKFPQFQTFPQRFTPSKQRPHGPPWSGSQEWRGLTTNWIRHRMCWVNLKHQGLPCDNWAHFYRLCTNFRETANCSWVCSILRNQCCLSVNFWWSAVWRFTCQNDSKWVQTWKLGMSSVAILREDMMF